MTTEGLAEINPILQGFWTRPMAEIDADLARLRAEEPVAFRPEPELPDGFPIPRGAGYWAVTRYDDIVDMSRDTETFSSAAGITTLDLPPEFNEFFNSMIAMDDPRHARMRRIVSTGFTPRMLRRLDATIDDVAARIVAEVAPKGEVDFVTEVAAALPLRIICDLMDIPADRYDEVFDATNVILGAGDPDYVADLDDALGAILQAGADLVQTAMGFPSDPDEGLHIGAMHTDPAVPVTLVKDAVEMKKKELENARSESTSGSYDTCILLLI